MIKSSSGKNEKKIGLALGAGGARGLVHIGILKVLHKHKIYPDYLAGTSMGAVIAAAYAAGRTPEDLEEIAATTDWREIVDFTVPKKGLIKGKLVERKIRSLFRNKKFSELTIPTRIVAYNFSKKEKEVFSRGDIADAVRASISIPGVFNPFRIGDDIYIDGSVTDPTPFDVVKEMGAEVIIGVDLFVKEKTGIGPLSRRTNFIKELKLKFITEELFNIKNWLFPTRWPDFIRKTLHWVFDKFFYPAKVIKMLRKKKTPLISRIMSETINILSNNLARERLEHADIDIKVTPVFKKYGWTNFDKVDHFVKLGEKAMESEIRKLKKKLRN